MKNIVVVQHAQSLQHLNGMVGSWADWDLTELGRKQAENIGVKLRAELLQADYAFYASDLLRARHTAEIIAAHFNAAPVLTPALRERNVGMAVGKSVKWMYENAMCVEKTVDDRMFSDGESRRDVWNRLLPFWRRVEESGAENIVIVTHNDTQCVFCALWLGLEPESLNNWELCGMPGGVSFFEERDNGKRVIKRFSDSFYRI